MSRSRSNSESESRLIEVDEELKVYYKEAFDDFDWNKNGRITCGVGQFLKVIRKLKKEGEKANHSINSWIIL